MAPFHIISSFSGPTPALSTSSDTELCPEALTSSQLSSGQPTQLTQCIGLGPEELSHPMPPPRPLSCQCGVIDGTGRQWGPRLFLNR
ncbi:hypothetical protein MHYP_G00153660 [Metynnis hypsauchen]